MSNVGNVIWILHFTCSFSIIIVFFTTCYLFQGRQLVLQIFHIYIYTCLQSLHVVHMIYFLICLYTKRKSKSRESRSQIREDK